MKHIELLKDLVACFEAIEWARDYESLEHAWSECKRSDWMFWLDTKIDLFTDKQRRLMACRFVRETPIGNGRTVWDLLDDERLRNAVIVAEKFANGEATQEELAAARCAARNAARNASLCASMGSSSAAIAAARNAAWAAAWCAARDAAWEAYMGSASAARDAIAASCDAAWEDYMEAQSDIIRSYGNPFNINKVKR